MLIGITELILAMIPLMGGVIGVYVKMQNLITKQDAKIINLEKDVQEIKRHNEKIEEKMFDFLDEIKKDVVHIKLHFGTCINYKSHIKK